MLKVVGSEAAQDDVDGRSLLDEIVREGAHRMLVAALETEVAAYLEAHRDERDADGHALVVRKRQGPHPEGDGHPHSAGCPATVETTRPQSLPTPPDPPYSRARHT